MTGPLPLRAPTSYAWLHTRAMLGCTHERAVQRFGKPHPAQRWDCRCKVKEEKTNSGETLTELRKCATQLIRMIADSYCLSEATFRRSDKPGDHRRYIAQ